MNEVDTIGLLEHLIQTFRNISHDIKNMEIKEPDPEKAEDLRIALKGQISGLSLAASIINFEKMALEEEIGHDLDAIEKERRDA